MSFSPDGSRVASGSLDKTIKLWDTQTGEEIRTLSGHQAHVWSVAFSPVGSPLASGSADKTIKLWDAQTGEEIRTLSGHQALVWRVAFSTDGNRLYSNDTDGKKFVWNCANGDRLSDQEWLEMRPKGNTSPDGRSLVVASGNEVLLVDLEFKNNPDEKAYREFKAKLDPWWHREQVDLAENANNWYGATFHRAWVMKADPASEASYNALHSAYDKWRNQIADGEKPADNEIAAVPATTQEATKQNDSTTPPKAEPNLTPNPDHMLAPVVREMLAIPRGGGKQD